MPEERGLYPRMHVVDQLVYLARLHGMLVSAARRSADAWTERLGVAERRDDDVKLSLGNQQRVQLAAALVHDPQILVLDEPFSGLDPVAVDVMSGVLREKADQGVPVVFSSHQLDLVQRLCDRVGIIRRGHMVADGTVDELRGAGPDLLVVDAPAARAGWADGIAGVIVRSHSGTRTRLELSPGTDDQAVLRAAVRRPSARIRPPTAGPGRPLPPHRCRRYRRQHDSRRCARRPPAGRPHPPRCHVRNRAWSLRMSAPTETGMRPTPSGRRHPRARSSGLAAGSSRPGSAPRHS